MGELDAAAEWTVDGARSAAGWLVAKTRAASGEAHHRVKVARQTSAMPVTAAAWRDGAVSTRHVDALTRVRHAARADAHFAVFESALVEVARAGQPEEVAATGTQWRDALDTHLDRDGSEQHGARQREARLVAFSRTLDGVGIFDGRFDTEGAEIIETALSRSYQRLRVANDPRSPGQQRADAFVEICRHYLDHQDRGTNRPHLLLMVDAGTSAGEHVGLCETISGYRLGPDTMRRLACDALVQRIIVGSDGVPLDEGGWTVEGEPNGDLTFLDPDGHDRGTTRPRNLPSPIPTRIGNEITRAHERTHDLQRRCAA